MGWAPIGAHLGSVIDVVFSSVVVTSRVEGESSTEDATPEWWPGRVEGPEWSGGWAKWLGWASLAGLSLESGSYGVVSIVFDSWGGVVSAAVVPLV